MRWPKSQIPIRPRIAARSRAPGIAQGSSHVVVTTFHPERHGLFLLAYDNGSITIHNANRVVKLRQKGVISDGLKRHCVELHHNPIVAAAFLERHKMRVATLGSKGKCRITDFEHGVNSIVVWEVGSICVAMTVLQPSRTIQLLQENTSSTDTMNDSNIVQQPADTRISEHCIAIGCEDGTVKIYSAIGLLKGQQSGGGHAVHELQWIPNYIAPLSPTKEFGSNIIDIDWPHIEPARHNATRKHDGIPGQSIRHAVPELHIGGRLQRSPPIDSEMPSIAPSNSADDTNQNAYAGIPQHSPLTPNKTRLLQLEAKGSRPTLLESLRQRKLSAQTALTPPRKDLNAELPGTSPREAQYDPVEVGHDIPPSTLTFKGQMIAPSKGSPSVAAAEGVENFDNRDHTARQTTPSAFESHLLGGALLSSKRRLHSPSPPAPVTAALHTNASRPRSNSVFLDRRSPHLKTPPARNSLPVKRETNQHAFSTPKTVQQPGGRADDRSLPSQFHIPGSFVPSHVQAGYIDKSPVTPPSGDSRALHTPSRHHLHVPGHFIDSDDDETLYEEAVEYGEHRYRSPWHIHQQELSLDGGEQRVPAVSTCNCDCADVVREEMALVRSEIASLRKTIWTMGTGMGTGASAGTARDSGFGQNPWFGGDEAINQVVVRKDESSGSQYSER